MYKLVLQLFLWWWPKLPLWLRYLITGTLGVVVIFAWIFQPEFWIAWLLLLLIILSMALYGEPSEAEKKGYRF